MSLSFKERFRGVIEAAMGKEQTLNSIELMRIGYSGPEDDIIEAKGVEGYTDMLRDAKVSADVDGAVSMAIPGIVVTPGDDSDKGTRNADFVRDVLTAMKGSTIDNIRTPFRNAIVKGLSVAQLQTEIKELPNWGSVVGVTDINLKPTCSFTDSGDGIKVDRFGNIEEFKQDGNHGGHKALPEDVIYYAFRGDANNRYGRSLLHSVYDPWKRKQKIFRIYALFMATNASGIREIKLPSKIGNRATTQDDLENAQERINRLATAQALATMKDWETQIHTPGSGTGGHFLEMIQEEDRQIDCGIYGDSAFSAQDQGSYASRTVSQSNVQARMRAWGDGYMESFSEQFCTMVLALNGFDGPLPHIKAEMIEDSGARIEKYKVLGDLKQKNLITVTIPDEGQKQIMQDLGLSAETLKDAETPKAPEVATTTKPPEVNASETIHAAAPSGRDNATLKRNGKQFDALVTNGARDLSDTWQSIVPGIMKKIDSQVFDSKTNGWKTQSPSKLREIVLEAVKYKSSEMRKSMDATLRAGNDLGDKHARSMVPVIASEMIEAAVGFTPQAVVQSLQSKTFLTLEQRYPKVASDIYYLLENAVKGDVAPTAVRAQIHSYLMESSAFTPGLANTIIDTSLSSAYNDARMSLFRQVVDVSGNTDGAITGYVFSAINDDYTSDICSELDGKAFAADDPSLPQPPLHFNCRSQLIPVFAGETPWTKESKGEFMSQNDSRALIATAQKKGQIQTGFGGF